MKSIHSLVQKTLAVFALSAVLISGVSAQENAMKTM